MLRAYCLTERVFHVYVRRIIQIQLFSVLVVGRRSLRDSLAALANRNLAEAGVDGQHLTSLLLRMLSELWIAAAAQAVPVACNIHWFADLVALVRLLWILILLNINMADSRHGNTMAFEHRLLELLNVRVPLLHEIALMLGNLWPIVRVRCV